ncbi:MAG: TolC family protein [Edaphobacter sp.]|uniref:TolC family protein n=1 Tax=Edaphobacter sp. TaxID=1934404 RepID=UPI0023A5425A|nr:TolC family protein [Edaphobacter sp.]MDE1176271.1 TolC family protein [Edaphobacter sp.]
MTTNLFRAIAVGAILSSTVSVSSAQAQQTVPASSASQTPVSPGPLTLSQAVARALAANPTLQSAQQHVSAIAANKITAGLRQNPTLTLYGQGISLPETPDSPSGNPFFYSANVSRLFERGQKRRWRLDSATAASDSIQSQFRDQQRQLVLNVRQAFTNMLLAKESLAVAKENLTDYHKTVQLSQSRLDAGDITRTDFERIDLQQAQFEADADNAELGRQQASAQLQTLLGVDRPSPDFDVTGTLETPPLNLTEAEAENQALTTRPDYQAARQALAQSEAEAKLAIAGGKVDPTVGGEYDRNGINNSFGLSLAVPLRIFDRNQGEKERTKYEVDSSRSTVTAARNQVVSDVDQAWMALDTAQRLAKRYSGHYADEAGRVRDNLQFSYRNGNSTLLDYLSALRDYRAVRLSSLNANAQVWLALHQLSFATATDIIP